MFLPSKISFLNKRETVEGTLIRKATLEMVSNVLVQLMSAKRELILVTLLQLTASTPTRDLPANVKRDSLEIPKR